MKLGKINRRKFIFTTLLATSGAMGLDATCVEPTWLRVRRIRLSPSTPVCRLVHFSDVHHKGDRDYLRSVVNTINSLSPDLVCFTGDIVEDQKFLAEALEILSGIRPPMFGVPGNHDYWSGISFEPVRKCFAATGGEWLLDASRETAGGKINLIGGICLFPGQPLPPSRNGAKNILLNHYPARADALDGRQFDLLLAGHSHGGQVRLPLLGPIVLPRHVGEYNLGLYQTPAGPLYVNPGIGYIGSFDIRFNCRPEITVFEV